MSQAITRGIVYTLSRLIWLCIIFFAVVHVLQSLELSDTTGSVLLRAIRYFNGAIGLDDLFAPYWPKEIAITVVGYLLFEAIAWRNKIRPKAEDLLEPLDLDIEFQDEKSKPGQVLIQIRNDEKTPIEFVVLVLEKYCRFSHIEAVRFALNIHKNGVATTPWINGDTAIAIVEAISHEAKKRSYPLECRVLDA